MPKKKIQRNYGGLIYNNSKAARAKIKQYYIEKYFNKFLSQFEFEGIDYQQKAYIMRKFWDKEVGTVACFPLKGTKEPVFCPWTPAGLWNAYDYPTEVMLTNTRGLKFFPKKPVKLDQGACIGYIQRDRKGIYANIEPMIDKIVDFEMTIRTNLKAIKTPWLIGVTPENEDKMKQFKEMLDSDDPYLFVSIEDLQLAKALLSGVNYNIDKLENQRQQAENEILTRLGMQNLGLMEKKEHFTVDEVNSNNQQIASSGNEFIDCLNEWFTNIDKYLGIKISVKLTTPVVECSQEEEEEESSEEDTDNE